MSADFPYWPGLLTRAGAMAEAFECIAAELNLEPGLTGMIRAAVRDHRDFSRAVSPKLSELCTSRTGLADPTTADLIQTLNEVTALAARAEEDAYTEPRRPVADEYAVRVSWTDKPEPCYWLAMTQGGASQMRLADPNHGMSADRLRVHARELVARAQRVELVDCPANVLVWYHQSAVDRLLSEAAK